MNPLQMRLAVLRRRLCLAMTARGAAWITGTTLIAVTLACWLDWRVHLPAIVREVALVATLTAAGLLAYRLLRQRPGTDELSLAFRIESLYPALTDSLASTVEFLRQPEEAEYAGSPELRRAAVARAVREAQARDFEPALDTRGLLAACVSLTAALACAVFAILLRPSIASTALVRLADPFGSHEWPRQTCLEVTNPRSPVARGEPYEVEAMVSGVVPDHASIDVEGATVSRLTFALDHGRLAARLEPVQESFRFRVTANDAASNWYDIEVLPPPTLVPLGGRASPQVRLHYPAYTGLPDLALPDGSGNVEAVAGTQVNLDAAADRPLARAWIAYRPEQPPLLAAAFLEPLGAPSPLGAAELTAAAVDLWDGTRVRLEADGRVMHAAFVPRVSGTYALHFEDRAGLGNNRLFDLRVHPDPAPTVNLERPSSSRDYLDRLAGADVGVEVSAEDREFGLRSLALEYRCARDEQPQRLILHESPVAVPAPLAEGKAGGSRPPQRLNLTRTLNLREIRHADGRPLSQGDVVVLWAVADDFDDVSLDKKPGRSHEVELRIVGRPALEASIDRAHAGAQQELLRLHKLQQEAIEQVTGPLERWRHTGHVGSHDLDSLRQAELVQQQLRGRVGNERAGLRAEVARALQSLRDSRLPRSGTQDRLETVNAELARLAREHLAQIESRLTNARKEGELGESLAKSPREAAGDLGDARRRQGEVENTLANLLRLLEPWGNINEAKNEAKDVLRQQQELGDRTESLKAQTLGRKPEELDATGKAALAQAADMQSRLAERVSQLLQKMQRVSEEAREKATETTAVLRDAAAAGRKGDIAPQLESAGADIRENRLGAARAKQARALRGLTELVRSLEEQREQELERLTKKLRAAEEDLADLTRRQEALRKKARAAGKLGGAERERQLKRLAREQQELRQESERLLRELTRLRAEEAGEALTDAGAGMEEAGRQLSRAEDASKPQDETLDRLQQARRSLRDARARAEDELSRERLAKVADQAKLLKERQQAAVTEAERLQQAARRDNGWSRPLRASLADLADAQAGLAQETDNLARQKLGGAKVLAHMVAKAAGSMNQAAEHIQQRLQEVQENPEDTSEARASYPEQRDALGRLEQILQALR